jgi:hypothetical protein
MKGDKVKDLIELCSISKRCFKKSQLLETEVVLAWLAQIEYSELYLSKAANGEKLNAYQKKSLEEGLLEYWNDNLNIEVEYFWIELGKAGLSFKRKKTFENIISKKRFKNVEQAIDIYNDIYSQPMQNFENEELAQKLNKLYEVVQNDRDKRIKQFRKWIRNENVSFSDGLKFGENYAYIKRTGLFDEILSQKDREVIEMLSEQRKSTDT